jgi:hypothetical protein
MPRGLEEEPGDQVRVRWRKSGDLASRGVSLEQRCQRSDQRVHRQVGADLLRVLRLNEQAPQPPGHAGLDASVARPGAPRALGGTPADGDEALNGACELVR